MTEQQKEQPVTPDIPSFFTETSEEQKRQETRRRNIKAFFLFLVSAVYGFAMIFICLLFTYGKYGLSIFAIYLYGIIGLYGLMLLNTGYTNAHRNRAILTEVLEKSPEARLITDTHGNTIHANAQFKKLTQDTPSILGFIRLFDNRAATEREMHSLQSRASPAGSSTAEMHTNINGRMVWFEITCQFIVGMPGYVNWRFDDITLKRQMESTIREEREKLRDFTDNAPVGFFAVDGEGKFQFANDTLLRLMGTDTATLLGRMRLHDFLAHPPKDAKPYDCFQDGGFHQHGELLMKGAGGRLFKAAITHSIAHDADGAIISRSIVYDLTTEQKMQQALRESQDRFERLFEEAPVGICLLSAAGIINDTNQTLAAMLRRASDAVNGKLLADFIHKDMQHRVEDWLQTIGRGERTAAFIEVQMQGTPEVVAQLYARKLRDGNFVLHFIDLTDQKNLERQFTQSQKMQAVGQLAGGIAHDFNNLLTAMIGFCDLLILRHKPGDPSFADIMQIKQNANRAANLVRQLLAFSRQQTLQPKTLDLTDVLSDLSHLLRRLIGSNIDLTLHHGIDLGNIKADQGQMDQVLINLVVNARDAMPQGGILDIKTRNFENAAGIRLSNGDTLPPGRWVTVAVTDTGTGISPDILPRIFEPFFSTKDVGAGTGLGLATVHGIIHQTGGYISVDSTLGEGTCFTIYLPRHTPTADEMKKPEVVEEKQVTSDLTGSAKILLVEDEDAVRTFSARALSNKGYQVMDAASGVTALQILADKKFEPEILITDVMMPEMDGTTLAKHVREKYPHVKIIFISGYAEDRFKEHLGADVWFLPKPFTLKQLATKVKEVIDHTSV
jgi:two-component system cell cycle sensor histidine kinase/response regulator CckA